MTRAEFDTLCAQHPGATLSGPGELDAWKIAGKMFACFGGEGEMQGVSVKTDGVETATMLIEAGAAIRAPYFHRSWVRLPFASTAREEARHRLHVSYDLVRKTLRKAQRDALPARETP